LNEKDLHQRLRPQRGQIPVKGPAEDPPSQWRGVLSTIWDRISDDLLLILFATGAGLVRAMGVTIESGQTGLLFSFGRARRTLAPGFHPLIPFLQRVRRLPTRSRTLDMPAQRVVTLEGLVYHVDANLVYRVIDVRKALVEVDHLEKGMIQMLGMGIQEVLRQASRDELRETTDLDQRLADNLAQRLAPWGVGVEGAGFPSITPSPRTLRITQLASLTDERQRIKDYFAKGGLSSSPSLGLIGTRHMPRSRTRHLRRQEFEHRRLRRIRTGLLRLGWSGPEQARAGLSLILRHRLAQRA
jgi:hypothetical protein